MRHFLARQILALAAVTLACTACVSTGSSVFDSSAGATLSPSHFGDEFTVQATIGTIKSQGRQDRVSSRAIRLPERPLGEIVVYDYQFPASCGGHGFRVLEADELQILEYEYAANNGSSHTIRDYVSGPSPFVQAGLWGAYDHTADGISTMTSQLGQSGDRMFAGVYSQGLVTSLPVADQRALGTAYQQAVNDVSDCAGSRALVVSAGE